MGTIVVEVPEECKGLIEPFENLVRDVLARRRELGCSGRGIDYAAVEVEVADATAAVERAAHATLLQALDLDAPRIKAGEVELSRVGRSTATYYTLAGPIELTRTLYRSGRDSCTDAISLRIGTIGAGWLPQTARAMAHEVARHPTREAALGGEETRRLRYSRTAFEHVAHAVGAQFVARHQEIEEALSLAYEPPAEARSISVSLDRVSVPMEEPRPRPVGRPKKGAAKRPVTRAFRMAYVGTLTLHDAEGKALHTIRYGTMPAHDPDELVTSLCADTVALLRQRPELKVDLLCDGAPEMWALLEKQFNERTLGKPVGRRVDFHHLVEKLAPAADLLFGDHAKAELAKWRLRLLNQSSAAEQILADLCASGREYSLLDRARPVHDAITYLQNHAGMFDYAAARRAGLPIGSGNVEATCKSLFQVRLKRGGARWKEDTGEHIVHLRAALLSDRWDPALKLMLDALRISVRRAA